MRQGQLTLPAASMAPLESARPSFHLAKLLRRTGRHSEATDLLRGAARLKPAWAEAHAALAAAHGGGSFRPRVSL